MAIPEIIKTKQELIVTLQTAIKEEVDKLRGLGLGHGNFTDQRYLVQTLSEALNVAKL